MTKKANTPIGRHDETFRRECEARLVLALGDRIKRRKYYQMIVPYRGEAAMLTLKEEVMRQYKLKQGKGTP